MKKGCFSTLPSKKIVQLGLKMRGPTFPFYMWYLKLSGRVDETF